MRIFSSFAIVVATMPLVSAAILQPTLLPIVMVTPGHTAAISTPTPTTFITMPSTKSVLAVKAWTTSPPTGHRFEYRQKCWNDQGFSVNCATWTGYYYTWGPPGNPYEGGPGEGGGGGGGGGTATVISYARASTTGLSFLLMLLASFLALLSFLA
jgi:hypothetical protein